MTSEFKLSKHFCENWYARVGNWPNVEAVKRYISEAVKVQHCRELQETDGSPYRMLAVYWHPGLKLVMTIDHISETAVSVLSEENWTRGSHGRFNLENH